METSPKPAEIEPHPKPFRVTVEAALRSAIRMLSDSRVEQPEMTARLFLSDVLACDKAWLFAHPEHVLQPAQWESFVDCLTARRDGVPTQYIRGKQEFFGLEFRVTSDVLIPRPETEHLVEAALDCIRPGNRIVDIGTGSGAIAVAVAVNSRDARVWGSDLSAKAVETARANARRLGAAVEFVTGDLAGPFAGEAFDVVVSNPPYVPRKDIGGLQRELRHEPSVALFGGEDGFEAYRRLVPDAARIVKPGGRLMMELGYNSRGVIEELLHGGDWSTPEFRQDLAGIDRVVSVRRKK